MAKFKVGDKVVRADGKVWFGNEEYFTVTDIWETGIIELNGRATLWSEKELNLYGEAKEDKMEKTFKEVIADIKEGEVWECTRKNARVKTIRMSGDGDNSVIAFDYGREIIEVRSAIKGTDRFKLKRKEYTFEEAFKAYEEGKEIESCIEGQRYKKEGGEDYYFDFNKEKYILLEWDKDIFTITSIRNKWYIND